MKQEGADNGQLPTAAEHPAYQSPSRPLRRVMSLPNNFKLAPAVDTGDLYFSTRSLHDQLRSVLLTAVVICFACISVLL